MTAARTGAGKAVDLLLGKNADPDVIIMVNNGEEDEEYTALIFAIESDNYQIVLKLMEVTNTGLRLALEKIAESTFDWNDNKDSLIALKSFIKKKIEKDHNLFQAFFKSAAVFGNRLWIYYLRSEFPNLVMGLNDETKNELLKDVTYSDDANACKELVEDDNFHVNDQIKLVAASCCKTEVIKALGAEQEINDEENDKRILKDIIKSEEFQYENNIEKLIKEFLAHKKANGERKIIVKMVDIVEKMLADPVHYNLDYEKYSLIEEDCPLNCPQPRVCLRIRQTLQLIKDILKKIGERYPVFQEPKLIIVGSLKEGTKIGFIDEVDVALIMNQKYDKEYFVFDEKKQKVKINAPKYQHRSELPNELAQFVLEDGTFDCTTYFRVFVEEIKKVIEDKSVEFPEELSLSVSFTPCGVCISNEDIVPQYVRCKHKPDCEEHKKTKLNRDYKEQCNCEVYNLPSLTYSKIGVVLHLCFQEKDQRKPFVIDVDVNPPTIPIENVKNFNGSNKMKRLWLKKNRQTVRNWRAEWRKSHDMSAAGRVYVQESDKYGMKVKVLAGKRSVRFRFVNRNLVIPEQVNCIKLNKTLLGLDYHETLNELDLTIHI